jgi:class 3 adenylate cyclase
MVKSIEPEAAGRGGPALVAARPATVRRYVAVMFTDIANSTQLNELLGDPEWSRVRSRHRKLLQECFAAHAGAEVGSQGDGALARFAQPIDAVSCAIDIQRRLDHQREDAGFAPTVRIGVHAGDAVEDEGDLVGRVVNVAARVMTEAAPGEILVTESVAEHLDGRHEVEGRGLHTLKGVARPRHLLAVRWS